LPLESAPNGILIGPAVFAGLTNATINRQTDRDTDTQTDHATLSVSIGCCDAA